MGLNTLETTRLIFCPWSLADIDALHQMWTDPEVRRCLWDDEVISRETAASTVAKSAKSAAWGCGVPCVSPAATLPASAASGHRRLAGYRAIVWIVACILAARFGDRGGALQYGFEHGLFTRVYGGADVPNRASVRVLERLGMIFERKTFVGALPTLIYSPTRPNQRSGTNDLTSRFAPGGAIAVYFKQLNMLVTNHAAAPRTPHSGLSRSA